MLFSRVSMLEQLYDWACLLGDFRRTSRGLYTVFERGLINHIAYYQDFASPEIIELGERFAKLGLKQFYWLCQTDIWKKESDLEKRK